MIPAGQVTHLSEIRAPFYMKIYFVFIMGNESARLGEISR